MPVLAIAALVVFAGRMSTTTQEVISAARDAARAAAVLQTPDRASAAAVAAAESSLGQRGLACVGGPQVMFDRLDLEPGGAVAVTVECTVGFDDLTGLGLPGARTVSGSSTAVVDVYRGGGS